MTSAEDLSERAVCVVGLGSIGARHLRNLRALGVGRLGAVRVRRAPPPGDTDLTGVAIHATVDEAIARGYDAVVVANPTALHLEVALQAARAGLDVYLEKPVAHDLSGVDALQQAVEERGVVLHVGCQLRYHPLVEEIGRVLARGVIGKPLTADVETGEYLPDWHPWEDYRTGYAARRDLGGGVLLTFIHEMDLLYSWFGALKPLAAVGGQSGELELDVEDHVLALLRSDGGVGVSLHLDYLQRPPVRRVRIRGSAGALTWDYHAGTLVVTSGGKDVQRSVIPEGWERNDLFVACMRDFLRGVVDRAPTRVPLADGIATLRTTTAVLDLLEERTS